MMESKESAQARLKENLLECMTIAALGDHDLNEWEQVDDTGLKWQSACKKCGLTIYASAQAKYNLLADTCPGEVVV